MAEIENRAKQPVSSMLAGPYGHPFHPILVTVPIGAWLCSLVFDIAAAHSSVAYNGVAGVASATFPGERWLASGDWVLVRCERLLVAPDDQ